MRPTVAFGRIASRCVDPPRGKRPQRIATRGGLSSRHALAKKHPAGSLAPRSDGGRGLDLLGRDLGVPPAAVNAGGDDGQAGLMKPEEKLTTYDDLFTDKFVK
jgi:hypothetical protein